jgi:7-carboxy-7-deazaguanine synthase
MTTIEVCETFVSIQGESTYSGFSCFFVRLSGCNLSCAYCDTPQARTPGAHVSIQSVVDDCVASRATIAEITGGEPLLQPGFVELAVALRDKTGKKVLVETNGSQNISIVPEGVIAVMDVKTPGSGMSYAMNMDNLARLRPYDEVKFVLADPSDYKWAKAIVLERNLHTACHAVLFGTASASVPHDLLAQWIIDDGLPVRLHAQMHRLIGVK